jgi:hypothetical protein
MLGPGRQDGPGTGQTGGEVEWAGCLIATVRRDGPGTGQVGGDVQWVGSDYCAQKTSKTGWAATKK